MLRRDPIRQRSVWLMALFAALAPAVFAATPAQPAVVLPPSTQLQQQALGILKAAGDVLAAAKTLSFAALIEEEGAALNADLPLQFSSTAEVALQRPDKLFVASNGPGPASEFSYDGNTMTVWVPQQNLVAVAPAPPTIDAMLQAAFATAAIYFPFTDLLVTDPYGDLVDGMDLAFYIGQTDAVGGTTTDMIAFRTGGVFVQAWIGVEDKLPRRLRAVFLDDPGAFRHDLVLSDWKLNGKLPPDRFVAKAPAGAARMPFAHPAAKVPSDASPTPPAVESNSQTKQQKE